RDSLRSVVIGRHARRDRGKNSGWGDRIGAQVHRADVENYDVGAAIADKEDLAIGGSGVAIRPGHRVHAVGAGSAALGARESSEVATGTKARVQVEPWTVRPSHIGPAGIPNEIAKHVNGRRNDLHRGCRGSPGVVGLKLCGAWTGAVTGVGDAILPLNRENSEISGGIDNLHGNSDAIGNVIQILSRDGGVWGDGANVERVERSARLARGVVLRHGNDVDDGIGAILRRAASGAIRTCATAAHDHKQCRDKNAKQNSRSHQIPSCDFPSGPVRPAPAFTELVKSLRSVTTKPARSEPEL